MAKDRLTEEEAQARDAELRAAGIEVVTPSTSVITLLRAKGEIVPLPGIRRPTEDEAP